MSLRLSSASFDDASLGARSTHTDDGQVLSILFDSLHAESAAADTDAVPQTRRAEGVVTGIGSGWVSVQVSGTMLADGAHGYAHVLGWANGRRLRASATATEAGADEPFVATVSAPIGADGQLRLSLLLLAQRDLGGDGTAAACWIDSVDIEVVAAPRQRAGAAR